MNTTRKIYMNTQDKETVRIFPLGGIGNVTKNMYIYEYRIDGALVDLVIVDCGIGFPDEAMYGVDLVIPDITYLEDKKDKIRGLVLTHGHEDHIGALSYILPHLPPITVYGTRLTVAFVEAKLKEFGIKPRLQEITSDDAISLGKFTISPVRVTHSIPDASNLVITTPIGVFYHGSDFKFDLTPIDNKPSELGKIAQAGEKGILCLLSDSLGSERSGYTLSEQIIEDTIEDEVRKCGGKFLFATQSSNISRISQAIKVALKYNRKIAFLGRSVEQNVEVAIRLGYITVPQESVVHDKQLLRLADDRLFIIVAGSQGQADSGLARISRGEHKFVKLNEGDVVMISADPIPGNEAAVSDLINTLTQSGAKVSHSGVMDDVHVSGHGSQHDLRLMISLTKPKYMLPIGGTYRHMIGYRQLAQEMGYKKEAVLIPQEGDVIEFSRNTSPRIVERIKTNQIMIDGFGVGDVGAVVLRDRQTLATEGIVVIIIPFDPQNNETVSQPDIISRGFVYMKESGGLVGKTLQLVMQSLESAQKNKFEWHSVRREVEERVGKYLFKETGRKPLVVPVLVEV